MNIKKWVARYAEVLGFIATALFILLPLLSPGFILTIDMVFAPHPPLPVEMANDFVFRAGLHALSFVIPGDILQKLLLAGVLLFSGIGAQRLNLQLLKQKNLISRWAAFAGGLVYMVNPFVYGRFMAGQYAVLLGYALLPFFIRSVVRFVYEPSRKTVSIATLWALAISIVSIHIFGIAAGAALLIFLCRAWRTRGESALLKRGVAWLGAGIGAFLVLSSYWLLPVALGKSTLNTATAQFGAADIAAFAADGGLINILQLKGFWLETQQLFLSAGEPLPLSGVWQLLLWSVVATGFVFLWKRQKDSAVACGVLAMFALLFALDSPFSQWFATHIPGSREPHKFVALLALCFSVFFAFGAKVLITKLRKQRAAVIVVMSVLPLLVTPAMIWGFHGQLQPTDYPKNWYSLNEKLGNRQRVLFLPWHMYMKFGFTQRIIANPADAFFDSRVIASQDPEFAGSHAPYTDATGRKIDKLLQSAPNNNTLGTQLRSLGVTYILLAKEGDWKNYTYLDEQKSLNLAEETTAYKLYGTAGESHE